MGHGRGGHAHWGAGRSAPLRRAIHPPILLHRAVSLGVTSPRRLKTTPPDLELLVGRPAGEDGSARGVGHAARAVLCSRHGWCAWARAGVRGGRHEGVWPPTLKAPNQPSTLVGISVHVRPSITSGFPLRVALLVVSGVGERVCVYCQAQPVYCQAQPVLQYRDINTHSEPTLNNGSATTCSTPIRVLQAKIQMCGGGLGTGRSGPVPTLQSIPSFSAMGEPTWAFPVPTESY